MHAIAVARAVQGVPGGGAVAAAGTHAHLARVIHCIYQDGDGITTPTHRMKRMVKDLLFNPIL